MLPLRWSLCERVSVVCVGVVSVGAVCLGVVCAGFVLPRAASAASNCSLEIASSIQPWTEDQPTIWLHHPPYSVWQCHWQAGPCDSFPNTANAHPRRIHTTSVTLMSCKRQRTGTGGTTQKPFCHHVESSCGTPPLCREAIWWQTLHPSL